MFHIQNSWSSFCLLSTSAQINEAIKPSRLFSFLLFASQAGGLEPALHSCETGPLPSWRVAKNCLAWLVSMPGLLLEQRSYPLTILGLIAFSDHDKALDEFAHTIHEQSGLSLSFYCDLAKSFSSFSSFLAASRRQSFLLAASRRQSFLLAATRRQFFLAATRRQFFLVATRRLSSSVSSRTSCLPMPGIIWECISLLSKIGKLRFCASDWFNVTNWPIT